MMSKFLLRSFIILIIFGLSGCMLGPDFHTPAPPYVQRYTNQPLPHKTVGIPSFKKAGVVQTYEYGADINAEWWRVFHSKEINALIDRGITNSPNLAAAYAALRQSQEIWNAELGNSLFPAINAIGTAQRARGSTGQNTGGVPGNGVFNLFNANLNVAYTFDLFGGARRQLEALQAQVDYQQFLLIGAYLTLSSNIATTVVTAAALEAQIKSTKQLIREQKNQLDIYEKQFRLGAISKETVYAQETLLGQTESNLPPFQKRYAEAIHALAVLTGDLPNVPIKIPPLDSITLPKHLPVSLPSRLVRQRPDVRASEALLHAASAGIGVATANLLPQVSLSAAYGYQGLVLSNLFSNANKAWNIAGQIAQPVFHGGALFAQRRGAIDAYQQALAQYRQTVLQAFQNVADSLKALEADARTLRATRRAEFAAESYLNLVRRQYNLGGVSYLAMVIAEQQYRQSEIARIQAQALRYTDTIALFQALGGGWWHKEWCIKESLGYC